MLLLLLLRAGTVEQAFGGKICCLINELSDATEDDDLREIQDKVDKVRHTATVGGGPSIPTPF